MKLSISMIVRGEQACLATALTSVVGADELIVVDTSLPTDQPDRSMEIAAEFGAKIYQFPWIDNYAAARNYALSKATGDFCLSIDCDEELEPDGISKIRAAIENEHTFNTIDIILVSKSNGEEHFFPRLFRRCPEVYWERPIHNVLNVSEENRKNDIRITYGYSEAHKKDPDRALRILTKELERNPKAVRETYYLAREYWYRKDYTSAIKWYKDYLTRANWMPERADAWLMLARCFWLIRQGEQAREACLNAISNNANFKEALLFMAEISWPKNAEKWREFAELATNEDVLFVRTKSTSSEVQVQCSDGVQSFKEKIPLKHYANNLDPCIFVGFYWPEDYISFKKHLGKRMTFWCGSDVSSMLSTPEWKKIMQETPATHYCSGQQLREELLTVGIDATVVPMLFGKKEDYLVSYKPSDKPKVFMCTHPGRETEYGVPMAIELANRLSIEVHIYGTIGTNQENVFYHGQVSEKQMDQEIRDYQGCLRFNKHDGTSLTVIKASLMGLYPIVTTNLDIAAKQLSVLCGKKEPYVTDLSYIQDSSWFLDL